METVVTTLPEEGGVGPSPKMLLLLLLLGTGMSLLLPGSFSGHVRVLAWSSGGQAMWIVYAHQRERERLCSLEV